MRILMVTPRFPYPPDRGDTLRSWTALRGLAARHEVWLACADQQAPRPEHFEHVQRICRDVAVFARSGVASLWRGGWGLLGGASLTEGYFGDERLSQTLRRWSDEVGFDALLTYTSSIAPAVRAVHARRRVLDLCDVDSLKWETYAGRSCSPLRWFYRAEAGRVAALEAECSRAHDVCLLVNERERQKFAARIADVVTDVAPTAVNLEDYRADAAPEPPTEPIIGMAGSMFYPPNVRAVNWFGERVWPLVRRLLPQARWLVVGSRPARQVRRWGRCPGVTVTGYVPDVRPHLESMRVFVNPMEGDLGVQTKVVVAMAAGRAAVVSSATAAGLTYEGEAPFVIADTPEDFAAAVVRIATETDLWRRLSRRARLAAEANYRADGQVRAVERWLEGASHGGAAARQVDAPVREQVAV